MGDGQIWCVIGFAIRWQPQQPGELLALGAFWRRNALPEPA